MTNSIFESQDVFSEVDIANDTGIGLCDSIEIVDTENEADVDIVIINDADKSFGIENNMQSRKSEKKIRKSKKKISRPCVFCVRYQSALTRHLRLQHKDRPEVQNALAKPRR